MASINSSLIFLALLYASCISYAARLPSRDEPPSERVLITPDIDAFANSLLATWNSSGFAVAVVQRDSKVPGGWRREFGSYGVAKDDGTPMTPDTLFAIASNSKLFLSFSAGLLISNETLANERGRNLEWTTKAQDVLPEWGLMDEEASKGTAIQDMLSHRTGLPRHDFLISSRPGRKAEMVATLKYLRPSTEFRETFQYNNLMYECLTLLPPVLLNQSYESYIAQHLFDPLNMTSSTYSVKDAESSGKFADGFQWSLRDLTKGIRGTRTAVVPYVMRNGTESNLAGAGGVISSARDLSIWASMLLNNGRHPETNEVVVPEAVVEHVATGMTIYQSRASYPELSPIVYGHGQMRYSYRGHEIIEHGGSVPGYRTQVARYPYDDLAIVVLSNDDQAYPMIEALKWRITDEIFGLPKIDWDTRYQNATKAYNAAYETKLPRPANVQPPSAPLESLEKSYSHPAYGTIQPCYVGGTHNSSSLCANLLNSSNAKLITAASDPNIPTFIIPFSSFTTTHFRLTHFDKNIFNVSMLWTNKEVREEEGYGSEGSVLTGLDAGYEVEWVNPGQEGEGLAFKGGIWGMGEGGRSPEGTGEASAEVWFKLDAN
ncbi:hypothetical protein AMATHDRAFT_2852 [Amanita thiersii Skay4041]|uniref:Beta-lactamase-related domain-containing protein n=1 Tax=Amanita thiersii Skay4041 TaxID=703135 RepID=A0A2A9NMI2_9AGAR|nr:hypothetical protein AMATHDRAFT_2852 [Amanita thiersii Skay4041]